MSRKLLLCGDSDEKVIICTAGRKSRYNCGSSSSRDLNLSIIFIAYGRVFFHNLCYLIDNLISANFFFWRTSVQTDKEKAYLHKALSRGASYERASGRQLCILMGWRDRSTSTFTNTCSCSTKFQLNRPKFIRSLWISAEHSWRTAA